MYMLRMLRKTQHTPLRQVSTETNHASLLLDRQERRKAIRAINEAKEARKVNELLVGETVQGGWGRITEAHCNSRNGPARR